MASELGDQRYKPKVWAFGSNTTEIIHDARVKVFTPEWNSMYDAALVIGRPVGVKGRPVHLWHFGEKHRVFNVPMACLVEFTRKPEPEKYVELPIDADWRPTLF